MSEHASQNINVRWLVKVGDLVRISAYGQTCAGQIGVIVCMEQFGIHRKRLPRVFMFSQSKTLLFGRDVCEVINESR